MPMSLEYRQVRGINFRTVPDGRREGRVIADVLIYNKIDDYRTSFSPGVFSDSLRDHLPKMLWAHNMMEPIGQWVDADDNRSRLRMVGELDLEMVTAADGRELDIPAVPMAHRAWTQLQKRTIDQFSVGFMRLADSPHPEVRGATQIDRAWLDEASPVLIGSVPGTKLVGVRSAQRHAPLERERRSAFLLGEVRANPTGYNQYKHMAGSGSPSAQKALKQGPRALAGEGGGGAHAAAAGGSKALAAGEGAKFNDDAVGLTADGKRAGFANDVNSGVKRDADGDYFVSHGASSAMHSEIVGAGANRQRKITQVDVIPKGGGATIALKQATTWNESSYAKSPAHAERVWRNRGAITNVVRADSGQKGGVVKGPRLRVKFNSDGTMDINNYDNGKTIATGVPAEA